MDLLIIILQFASCGIAAIGIIYVLRQVIIIYRTSISEIKEIKEKLRRRNAILYTDYKKFPIITDAIRSENYERIFVGGVRINSSAYRTDKEDQEYRNNSLLRDLP